MSEISVPRSWKQQVERFPPLFHLKLLQAGCGPERETKQPPMALQLLRKFGTPTLLVPEGGLGTYWLDE